MVKKDLKILVIKVWCSACKGTGKQNPNKRCFFCGGKGYTRHEEVDVMEFRVKDSPQKTLGYKDMTKADKEYYRIPEAYLKRLIGDFWSGARALKLFYGTWEKVCMKWNLKMCGLCEREGFCPGREQGSGKLHLQRDIRFKKKGTTCSVLVR